MGRVPHGTREFKEISSRIAVSVIAEPVLGIDGIRNAYRGKLCALVDIDEQMMPVCSPEDLRSHTSDPR